jgi:hypothetical protein
MQRCIIPDITMLERWGKWLTHLLWPLVWWLYCVKALNRQWSSHKVQTNRLEEKYLPRSLVPFMSTERLVLLLLQYQRIPEFFCHPAYSPHVLLFSNYVMNAVFPCLWHNWHISSSFKSCTLHRISVGFSGWWYGESLRICHPDGAAILPTLYWQHIDKRDTGMQSNTNS